MADAPTHTAPAFGTANGLPIATWTEGGNDYLLATEDDGPDLRTLF